MIPWAWYLSASEGTRVTLVRVKEYCRWVSVVVVLFVMCFIYGCSLPAHAYRV